MVKKKIKINKPVEPRITVLGGGTGLSVLLRGLKKYTSNLTAIVAVSDDGGSSGLLRKELGILPPGDIRNCLVSLSEEENLMAKLFQYRFPYEGSLAGHSFGNLFLTAMSAITGSFDSGIAHSSKVLAIRGRVLPVTLNSVSLEATLENGNVVRGESNITKSIAPIKFLKMYPESPKAAPQVIDAIKNSDCIVMGPGFLYTSVIANLLVKGVSCALRDLSVPRIYVCNIMTQPNETKGYNLDMHLEAIYEHSGPDTIDYVIVNNGKIPAPVLARYKKEGACPVEIKKGYLSRARVIKSNIVSVKEYARHDPDKLSKVIIEILAGSGKA